MYNIDVVIKPDETVNDIIEQICYSENIGYDDPFAFSAIMIGDKLKINCIEEKQENPFTPIVLITSLFNGPTRSQGVKYVVAPLEQYLTVYRPMLFKMVNKAYPYYQKLIPDREDMMSILFLTIVELYNKGYYLHNRLIYKSFINSLNMEIRKLKNFQNITSLDAPIGQDDEGHSLTLSDLIEDPTSSEQARQQMHYTEKDYWEELFETLKSSMLKTMSQLSFDRILIQIKSRTISPDVAKTLQKYRQQFNPSYIPRPNARGKNRGGQKKNGYTV